MNTKIFNINAIDEHFAFLYIVVTWYKINKSRLSATTLPNKCYGFTFRNSKVYIAQYPV